MSLFVKRKKEKGISPTLLGMWHVGWVILSPSKKKIPILKPLLSVSWLSIFRKWRLFLLAFFCWEQSNSWQPFKVLILIQCCLILTYDRISKKCAWGTYSDNIKTLHLTLQYANGLQTTSPSLFTMRGSGCLLMGH